MQTDGCYEVVKAQSLAGVNRLYYIVLYIISRCNYLVLDVLNGQSVCWVYWPSAGPRWCASERPAGRTPGQRGPAASRPPPPAGLLLRGGGAPSAPGSPPTSPSHSAPPPAPGGGSGRTRPDRREKIHVTSPTLFHIHLNSLTFAPLHQSWWCNRLQ